MGEEVVVGGDGDGEGDVINIHLPLIFSGKSLVWVAVLLLIILYVYAVFSFEILRPPIDSTENMFCETLGSCLVSILRFGLVDNFLVNLMA